MMKTIFRKMAAGALVTILGVALIPISLVQAQAGETGQRPAREDMQAKANDKFCTTIENNSGKFSENFEQKGSNLKTKKEEKQNRWTERQKANDERLAELREKAEATFEKRLDDLLAKSGITDAQKTAIETFRSKHETALATRHKVVDSARNNFETAVQNAVQTRQSGMDAVMATFKNSVSTAFATAKSSCAATDADALKIRETLRASLKMAKDKLAADRESNAKIKVSLESAIETRKNAFETARNTYKTTMEQARTTLRAAFSGETIDVPIE